MRPIVSVWGGAGRPPYHLGTDRRLQFGACGCGRCAFDLVVSAGEEPVAGQVTAAIDHWRLANLGGPELRVVDLEQPEQLLTVRAGRGEVLVPFELSRIFVGDQPLVTVFGPEPSSHPGPAVGCPAMGRGAAAHPLDPDTVYFAVLAALCEPRLKPLAAGQPALAAAALPTSAEIARLLARRGYPISARAVDFHIDYLIDKLGLRRHQPTSSARRSWRKEALAAAAMRRGLVNAEHLAQPWQRGQVGRLRDR